MLNILLGRSMINNGLEGLDMEKALRKIPPRELTIMTFKRLDEHMTNCARTSEATLKILRWVGIVVFSIAIEKLGEVFHFHIPNIGS